MVVTSLSLRINEQRQKGLFTSQTAVVRHLLLVAVLHQVLILQLSLGI